MATAQERVAEYLQEVQRTEMGLVRLLQAHLAMTPPGDYRSLLERHLRDSERHVELVGERVEELGPARGVLDTVQNAFGQLVAVSRAPLALVRGEGDEERLLKNARDECAAEALEIATYTALEAAAKLAGDRDTAELANSIRAEEERMLEGLSEFIPILVQAAAQADLDASGQELGSLRPAHPARAQDSDGEDAQTSARRNAQLAAQRALKIGRQSLEALVQVAQIAVEQVGEAAQRGEATVEATVGTALTGVQQTAHEAQRAIRQTAEAAGEGGGRSAARRQPTAARRTRARTPDGRRTRRTEPWPGYDAQTVHEITRRLRIADQELARKVRDYERRHKNRSTIIAQARRRTS